MARDIFQRIISTKEALLVVEVAGESFGQRASIPLTEREIFVASKVVVLVVCLFVLSLFCSVIVFPLCSFV